MEQDKNAHLPLLFNVVFEVLATETIQELSIYKL